MGDRNTPIKFGPEWLRMATAAVPAGSGGGSNGPSAGGSTSSSTSSGSGGLTGGTSGNALGNTNLSPKVQLAKLRYGREEMLALYDPSYITQESPAQLKYIDILYQVREKPPFALNNTFEHEMRDNMRGGPPISGMSIGDRINRGVNRGPNVPDNRNRPRMQFDPHQPGSSGRSSMWHGTAMPRGGFSAQLGEEEGAGRGWSGGGVGGAGGVVNNRNGREPPRPWQPNDPSKMGRTKRLTINTNWRNSAREEGSDEWRSSRAAQEKRGERGEWGERQGSGEKGWSGGRRTWDNDGVNSDETLPEWAVGSAEPVAGTFDASGAFHGYSNDDSSLHTPKQPDNYTLTRSHTHGTFTRSKMVEEGSDEWWASEKANKLSPKKFDATEIKFKKPSNSGSSDGSGNQNQQSSKQENPPLKQQTSREDASPQEPDKPTKFGEGTYDGSMRADVSPDDTGDERGNFQSVMIAPNNSLRQKHQNIVVATNKDNPPTTSKEDTRPNKNQTNNSNQNQTSKEEYQRQNDPFAKGLGKDDSFGQQKMPATKEEVYAIAQANHSILGQQKSSSPRASPEDKNDEAIVDQLLEMSLDGNKDMMSKLSSNDGFLQQSHMLLERPNSTFTHNTANSMTQLQNPMHMGINPSLSNQSLNINQQAMINSGGMALLHSMRMKNTLDVSLSLPLGQAKMGMPQPGLLDQSTNSGNPMGTNSLGNMVNANLNPSLGNLSSTNLTNSSTGIAQLPVYQPGLQRTGDDYGEFYLGQSSNSAPIPLPSDIPMPPSATSGNLYGLHNSQAPQNAFRSSLYGNMMPTTANAANLVDQWYYEDPNKVIQGPFPSKEMYNWYRAGFFSPTLMVRRAIDTHMRPLGSYGPVVPFAQVDMMPPAFGFESQRAPAQREPATTPQASIQMDVDALWRQPSPDMVWMGQGLGQLGQQEQRYNKMPMYFWDAQSQSSAIAPNSTIPSDITKDMKTEDEILAQLRAKQPFLKEPAPAPDSAGGFSAPNLEELQKLIQKETLNPSGEREQPPTEGAQVKQEKPQSTEQADEKEPATSKSATEAKATKQAKNEAEKNAKKEAPTQKSKKKNKEDKRDNSEARKEEDSNKTEKKSADSSPSKQKEKVNKKELEKEKKEWIKEGFTIVKGAEKKEIKDNKKKAEEAAKLIEEAERKRKEEEKLALEEERKRKQLEMLRKQQEQQQRQATEFVSKKAPWSVSAAATQAADADGMTLVDIQLLERKKKLEQMREQQQMMQVIAQHQNQALQREQEMQASLGWAKKKNNSSAVQGTSLAEIQEMQASLGWAKKKNNSSAVQGTSLAEIQAEARKRALALQAQALEEARARIPSPSPAPPPAPWAQPNGGFWDAQPNAVPKTVEKPAEPAQLAQPPKKKKSAAKKESAPAAEFEGWCTTILAAWCGKIDVPTFVGFLKDIESPYEVKDYVKYYLGESKEAGDFARQFLERRSKLLRVGMVTPSDDLCSPAVAVNPRTNSVSEYQEGKGKKIKKNKMLKVDARILGFSVTAAEDRINVGDIDTV